MDWPADVQTLAAGGKLTTMDNGSAVADAVIFSGSAFNSTSNLGSLVAVFLPVVVAVPVTVVGLGWLNGATVSGNLDVAIFDVEGALLCHAGSTAQSGISAVQVVNAGSGSMVSTSLAPGTYFLAIAQDNATGLVGTANVGAQGMRTQGARQATLSGLPFTTAPTFAAYATSRQPIIAANISQSGVF